MTTLDDRRLMDTALALATAQLGRTAPNPAVGCVIVSDGRIIGIGATADGGRPHAERVALDAAGAGARGATAYVTLEPCAFHGQTPPCADALIAAGIARVIIACRDAHPKVDGRGAERLEAAGVIVEFGLRQREVQSLYEGFFSRLSTGRPAVYVDERRHRFDATIEDTPPDALDQKLVELGERGLNRVCVTPGSPLARTLR